MLTGQTLFEKVNHTNGSAFWWLGQHSFLIKLAQTTLLIDPFLDNMPGRRLPPLFAPEDAKDVELVCCTHDHVDHIDPVAIRGLVQHSAATFVAPRACKERMLSLAVPENRLILLNADEAVTVVGIHITAIKAKHETFDQTPKGFFPYLGYVLEAEGKTLYHAGDTLWWEGLQARLSAWTFDVVFVPINGRDALRYQQGIMGNMTYQEAGDLVSDLDIKLCVPTHYDMFEVNQEDPEKFVAYMKTKYPTKRVWVGTPTDTVMF
ncbi:MAG: MBL fold metallo-hydrolase [Trueperaceae bacterium]